MNLLIVKRLAALPIVAWVVASIVFIVLRIVPGNAADVLAQQATYQQKEQIVKALGLDKPTYSGILQQAAIPRHPRENFKVLGSAAEIHLVFARLGDVWSVFAPHNFFFASKKWMEFNTRSGGLMAFATQMDVASFSYLVFSKGIKQTNAFAEGSFIRVVPDTPMTAYIGKEKIFEDKATCSLSDAEVRAFIERDLAIQLGDAHQLTISRRFPHTSGTIEDVMHFVFQRSSTKKGFLGIRWS